MRLLRIWSLMMQNRFSRFHRNQKGLETLQVVLIIAVAAIILALIVNQWPNIRDWANDMIDYVVEDENMDAEGS